MEGTQRSKKASPDYIENRTPLFAAAPVTASQSAAIGPAKFSMASQSAAIGPETYSMASQSAAIGPVKFSMASQSAAIGPEKFSMASQSAAIGPETFSMASQSAAIGPAKFSMASQSAAIGPEKFSMPSPEKLAAVFPLCSDTPDDIENTPIPLLATSIGKELGEELGELSPLSSDCCIFRVPKRLRHLDEKAYKPRVVSIGPLHHDEKGLRAMEEHKKRYLQHFLKRTGVSLENFLQKIRSQEANIRGYYAETIDMASDKFVKIILTDAAFILELLLRSYLEDHEQGDPIFNKPLMKYDIWPDMLLLENQLPFVILKDLLDPHIDSSTLVALSLLFFSIQLNVGQPQEFRLERVRSSHLQVKHFVDLMGQQCHPFKPPAEKNMGQRCLPFKPPVARKFKSIYIPSVTDLCQAGVKFNIVPERTYLFDLDIQFTGGILYIPKITIQDQTEVIIKNLVAFEQCNATENHITDYVIMMDRLVNASKDVDLLVDRRIIENLLGDSNEVSTLINNLGNGVNFIPSEFHYARVCEDLNNYYYSTWHRSKAILRQKYFNTPWASISVIAAVFLIILAITQTVCSIISVI